MERLEEAQACLDASSGFGEESGGLSVMQDGVLGDQALHIGPVPAACSGFWPVPVGVSVWNMETGARTAFETLTCIP